MNIIGRQKLGFLFIVVTSLFKGNIMINHIRGSFKS